jgi:hypothetical protein
VEIRGRVDADCRWLLCDVERVRFQGVSRLRSGPGVDPLVRQDP